MEAHIDVPEKIFVAAHRLATLADEITSFFEEVPDLCCIFSATQQFIRVSRSVRDMLGYTEEEFCQKDLLDLLHPDDVEKTRLAVGDLALKGPPIIVINRYKHKDGTYRTLAWNSSRFDENGKAYGIARDITHIDPEIFSKL